MGESWNERLLLPVQLPARTAGFGTRCRKIAAQRAARLGAQPQLHKSWHRQQHSVPSYLRQWALLDHPSGLPRRELCCTASGAVASTEPTRESDPPVDHA